MRQFCDVYFLRWEIRDFTLIPRIWLIFFDLRALAPFPEANNAHANTRKRRRKKNRIAFIKLCVFFFFFTSNISILIRAIRSIEHTKLHPCRTRNVKSFSLSRLCGIFKPRNHTSSELCKYTNRFVLCGTFGFNGKRLKEHIKSDENRNIIEKLTHKECRLIGKLRKFPHRTKIRMGLHGISLIN